MDITRLIENNCPKCKHLKNMTDKMKKVILNRPKQLKKSPMKETHTINQIEELMYDLHSRLTKALTNEERKAIIKQLKPLERHWRDVNDKHINGKKYPTINKPKDISKKELLELIDSVGEVPFLQDEADNIGKGLDLSGGSPVPGENRFVFREKGW